MGYLKLSYASTIILQTIVTLLVCSHALISFKSKALFFVWWEVFFSDFHVGNHNCCSSTVACCTVVPGAGVHMALAHLIFAVDEGGCMVLCSEVCFKIFCSFFELFNHVFKDVFSYVFGSDGVFAITFCVTASYLPPSICCC